MTTWVLLRGLTREAAHWGSFAGRFGGRVVALDLPGAGSEHGRTSPWTVAGIAADCRTRLLQQGVTPPYRLVGLSLGGMVAMAWASTWPHEVDGCVLVNTSMRPFGGMLQRLRPRMWLSLASLLLRRDPAAIERRVLQWTSGRPDAHAAVLDDWVAIRRSRPVAHLDALRQLWAAARYRAPSPLPALPVLVLCSEHDRLVDRRCSQRLAAHGSWPLAVHPDAGHDLPLDDPAWVVAVIRQRFAPRA